MSDPRRPSDTPSSPPDWDALARLAAGESTDAEAAELRAWLAAHPEDAALFETLTGAVARVESAESARPVDVEAALARVHERMDEPIAPTVVHPLPNRGTSRVRVQSGPRWAIVGFAAAAAAAILIVGTRGRGADEARSAGALATLAAGAERATPVGSLDSLRLADGTRVVLAPGSRLTVAADYGRDRRDVTLDGAAWFSVRHDAARPFTVRAGEAIVRDIGTEFSVRTDGLVSARGVAVVVTEGAVALRPAAASGDTGVVLAAGDRGELTAEGRVVAERGGAAADELSWTRGRLAFRDAPLALVRADLRRWYGVELLVEDPALAARRFTGDAVEGEPVARVLERIALAIGGEVSRRGDTVVLRRATTGQGAAR